MRGVILDAASLGEDVDLAPVLSLAGDWACHASTPATDVAARIRDAEVVLSNKVPLTAASLAVAPRLRLVVVMATGTNNVDLAAATQQGIAVCNARAYATASVAQHTMLLLLALARSLLPAERSARDGTWSRSPSFCVLGHPMLELGDRRLGIVGYGELGREVARLARAFGMQVALAALPGRRYADVQDYARMPLAQMLPWADVISLHCPLTLETRGMIGAAQLGLLPAGGLLVNTARGGIVDEAALAAALDSGRLEGAALDVFEREPVLVPGIASHPRVLATPHLAGHTVESHRARARNLVEALDELVARLVPEGCR